MAREKNVALRIAVPAIAVLAAIGVSLAVLAQSRTAAKKVQAARTQAQTTPAQEPAPHEPTVETVAASNAAVPSGPSGPATTPAQGSEQPSQAPAATPAPAPAPAIAGLRAMPFDMATAPLSSLGSLDPAGADETKVEFTPLGAGVEAITLARHFQTVKKVEHLTVQQRRRVTSGGATISVNSLAARGVEIDGAFVDLYSDASVTPARPVWRPIAGEGAGAFEALIVDDSGASVARVTRRFALRQGTYDIELRQAFENTSGRPLTIRFHQYGPVDLALGDTGYVGDRRRVRMGYLEPPSRDPSRQFVTPDEKLRERVDIVKAAEKAGGSVLVWPDPDAGQGAELVWAAMTNRYFTFAVHPLVDEAAWSAGKAIDKRLHDAAEVYAVVARDATGSPGAPADQRVLLLQLSSATMEVAPGASADLSLGAYAGPLWRKTLQQQPAFKALRLDGLILYNIGGPCAFCTFQWLARLLFTFLAFMHDNVVFDWSIAIMLLVVGVRSALHPITRRSQIGLMRFGKQMAAIAPKQQKLREKYGSDQKKLQQEMMKLYREENVKFSGALGCLPMFLQSPVWIALYAMLFFAFDLRHEPAFYGVVQSLAPGWTFLADLSAPDRFVDFGRDIHVPLLSSFMGPLHSVNLLPLLLGVVFFVQQKYLTPPPSAALTPEQETQQKIMKVMMVIMFPLLMYNAPSGLAIYFITNSALGILESRYIRSHVDKLDLEPKAAPGESKRKVVANQAANPFSRGKQREGSPWKNRDERKK